ncbi:MAG: hypothetical protein K2M17_00260 [Bacilli bacterium]|nr:hypothetical protein [Bacilli bacterium]
MNIENEEKFLELFGLVTVPVGEGYNVIDENQKCVGTIRPSQVEDARYELVRICN